MNADWSLTETMFDQIQKGESGNILEGHLIDLITVFVKNGGLVALTDEDGEPIKGLVWNKTSGVLEKIDLDKD